MWKRPHVKYPLFLSDFNATWIFTTDFLKNFKYQISLKSVQWEPRQTDRRTDKTKLSVAFQNFAVAPKNWHKNIYNYWQPFSANEYYEPLCALSPGKRGNYLKHRMTKCNLPFHGRCVLTSWPVLHAKPTICRPHYTGCYFYRSTHYLRPVVSFRANRLATLLYWTLRSGLFWLEVVVELRKATTSLAGAAR